MDPLTSEEGTLAEHLAQTSQGLETVLRIPQHVSAGLLALILAVAAVGAWLGVRKILELLHGWQSARRLTEAISDQRAGEARREAYEHARMLTPEQRGLRPAAETTERSSRSTVADASLTEVGAPGRAVEPHPEAFAPRPGRDPERMLLGAITTLVILAGLATLIFVLLQSD